MCKITEELVVSDGTMWMQDLMPAFLKKLRILATRDNPAFVELSHREQDACTALIIEVENAIGDIENGEPEGTYCDTMSEMFDWLDALAGPDFYFGARVDDGACYGFWRVESLQDEY